MTLPVYNISYSLLSTIALSFAAWRTNLFYRKTLFPLAKYFRNISLAAGSGCLIDIFFFTLLADQPLLLGIGSILGGL